MSARKKTAKVTEPKPLSPGDSMPPLEGIEWIKGAAPKAGGKPTLVEFWATWCPPCVFSIPHLTEIQHRHKGKLHVVGLTDEDADTARPFVEEQGKAMDYAVGVAPEATYRSYMEGVDGIPTAFLFDTAGRMVWKGHPMGVDRAVDGLVGGSLSSDALLKISELQQQIALCEQEIAENQGQEWVDAQRKRLELTRQLLALDPNDADTLCKHLDTAIYSDNAGEFHGTIGRIRVEALSGMGSATLADSLSRNAPWYRVPSLCLRLVEHSRSLLPDSPEVLRLCARLYASIGDFSAASEALQQAIKHADGNDEYAKEHTYIDELAQLAKGRSKAAGKPAAAKAAEAPKAAAKAAKPAKAAKAAKVAKPAKAAKAPKAAKAKPAKKAAKAAKKARGR